MALIKCPECGKEISDKAESCPNCGNPIHQQTQKEEYLCCPKCGSRELHAEHKGFSGGKALAGALITGGIGLLAGTIGSRDTLITCLKCGNMFKAGEARVIRNISDSDVTEEEKQILGIIQSQGLISAVKYYKDNHGCGLAEAKTYVDSLATKHNVQSASGNGCAILVLLGLSATVGSFFLF